MGKKNSFGKLLAFTTTVAAIGGVCYVFRDQIKESNIYKKACDKFTTLRDKVSDKFATEDDDFFFDDDFEDDFEDIAFADDAKKNREYTSITINAKEDIPMTDAAKEVADDISNAVDNLKESSLKRSEDTMEDIQETAAEVSKDVAEDVADVAEDTAEDVADAVTETSEEVAETVADSAEDMKEIFADVTIPTISFNSNNTSKADETSATEEPTAYENEGLSDVSEDPDVLADMDRLDF